MEAKSNDAQSAEQWAVLESIIDADTTLTEHANTSRTDTKAVTNYAFIL